MFKDKEMELDRMVSEAVRLVEEAKKKAEKSNESETKLNRLLERVVEYEDFTTYEVQQLALMYMNLAPEDISEPISIKMMDGFLKEVVEKNYPEEYKKIRRYYDFKNPLPDKKIKKLEIFVNSFWNRLRTVENCYKYSKGFKEMSDRIASKLDAPKDLGVVERCKWLRLWLFIIRDQSFFWNDIKIDKRVNVEESIKFDREVYLTPEVMIMLEKAFFSEIPDNSILLDIIKAFINLYPEKIQKEIIRFAELDKNEPDCLNAGYIRRNLKKKLFPVIWISGTGYFFTRPGIEVSREEFMTLTVEAYKKGLKNLETFYKEGIDPFNNFSKKKFTCYELGEITVDGKEKTFAVTSEEELKMYIEVYKWILAHPDFKFGAGEEKKTLKEYGLEGLLETQNDWFKEIEQKVKTPKGAMDMTAALKRIKTFGEASASKTDIEYLRYFKYEMKNNPKNLPKNIVNLYGKIFK